MYTSQKAVLQIRTAIDNAVKAAQEKNLLADAQLPQFIVERPADKSHGDFASNAAMASAGAFKTAPIRIAQAIKENISFDNTLIEKCEIAGPGFLNFFLKPQYYADVLKEIERDGKNYGSSDYGSGKKVMVEFISANPTGPMHMGNARGGALGDCLSGVLDKAGYSVWREFYVNDAGNQIEKFANSLNARYLQIFDRSVEFPEDGYQGGDITDHAKAFAEINKDKYINVSEEERKKALVEYALPINIAKMQSDTAKYKIHYDKWFFESELHNNGEVSEIIDILKDKGLTYEQDGAVWYKNKEVLTKKLLSEGKSQADIDKLELKDDVLVRNNGNPTYFAADIAYHRNKFEKRGFDICIDIWGADHHGHVARLKGAMDSVGCDSSRLHIVLMQLVRLMRNGELVRMSKRTGKVIQLGDLLEEVPIDSARFLFNTREANTQMDFDMDIAVKEDSQNPVYYVQYAHARICSIIKALKSSGIELRPCTDDELMKLCEPEEKELVDCLAKFEEEIITSAKNLDPTIITKYVTHLATLFHRFYNACRVKGEDSGLTAARLMLCHCTKTVIAGVLDMFNIEAPEVM